MKLKRSFICLIIFVLILIVIGCIDEGSVQKNNIQTYGTYENPANVGDYITISSKTSSLKEIKYQIFIDEIMRGEKVNNIVEPAVLYPKDPPNGYEFMFVKMNFIYLEGKEPKETGVGFVYAFSDGVELDRLYQSLPENYPKFNSGKVLPGGINTGWIGFIVPQNKEVIISYHTYYDYPTRDYYINVG